MTNVVEGLMHPVVSVIMPTYQHAKFIAQAIEGVLAQRAEFSFELLIGDDCSTDGTREICQRYAARHPDIIRLQLRPQNVGMYANWTPLYHAAQGDFLALCDGDDYWTSPEKLQRQVRALTDHPWWTACFHRTVVRSDDASQPESVLPRTPPAREITLQDLARENCMATSSVLYRRGVVPQVPDWFSPLSLGDWPLHLLHAMHGPFGYLDETMAVYRRHAGGAWGPMDSICRVDNTLRALFAVEDHADEPARAILTQGRREFLAQQVDSQSAELVRLRKIEARYRSLQLHHLSAVGHWLTGWFRR